MSLEAKWPTGEVIEVDEEFKVIKEYGPRKLITNDKVAFDIYRDTGASGKKREFFLAAYERQQQAQRIETTSSVSLQLRKTDEAKIAAEVAASKATIVADEKAENQEFLEAMNPSWEPSPDDWYEAKVTRRDLRRLMLNLALSDGSDVACLNKNITHGLAGHTLCVPEGTLASVRIEKHGNRYHALECRLQSDEPIKSACETLVLRSWVPGRTFGNGVRPCGCSVFATTSFRGGSYSEHREGDVVEADIAPSDRVPGLAMARIL